MRILCLNGGSSSLKLSVYDLDGDREQRELSLSVSGIGLDESSLELSSSGADVVETRHRVADLTEAAHLALKVLTDHDIPSPDAVGHRVVHGGAAHDRAARVTEALLEELRRLAPLAPLHQPGALALMTQAVSTFPETPQVACFDTAFHRAMPSVAQRLPLPEKLHDAGVRKYGFHGLSCEYVLDTLAPAMEERTIIAHLGGGASLTAVRGRSPIDTTMGMTPTGGVMMGTRSGDLDPGVVIYLARELGYSTEALDELLNAGSGLAGVSALSSDMRELLTARDANPAAALAVTLFCYRIRLGIGALAAALGGVDTLVFTGGIGEHQGVVRGEVCEQLAYLGIELDEGLNAEDARLISAPSARCRVLVLETQEDLVIARQTKALLDA